MKKVLFTLVCMLVIVPVLAGDDHGPVTYLMSISFANPGLERWRASTVKQFEATPYEGIAAKIHSANDRGPAPKPSDFSNAVKVITSNMSAGRHVWPWVFLNRIVAPKDERAGKFKGIDLDGSGQALGKFYDIWRTSLQLAKRLKAPGIVVDPQLSADPDADYPRYVAEAWGKSEEDVLRSLRYIGGRLADITKEEFPDAIIWSLFTGLESDPRDFSTVPALFDGMLMTAKRKNIPLTVVDGGKTVGYIFNDATEMKRLHKVRALRMAEYLKGYDGHLVVGAAVAPWADARKRRSWMARLTSRLKTIADFEPVFVELMRRYRYLWIYGIGVAPYNPLQPESASQYNPTLAKSLAEAKRLGQLAPFEPPALPNLADAVALYPELLEDKSQWRTTGAEASIDDNPMEQDLPFIRFIVDVEKKWGHEKNPLGWVNLIRDLDDVANLRGVTGIRFRIRFDQKGKIRIGLHEESATRTQWVPIWSETVGEWQDVAIPIQLFEPDKIMKAVYLAFNVAEEWYLDGDHVVFELENMFFCK